MTLQERIDQLVQQHGSLRAGSSHRSAWLVGLAGQALWLVWIVDARAWGLMPLNVALWIVYARNHWLWSAKKNQPDVAVSTPSNHRH